MKIKQWNTRVGEMTHSLTNPPRKMIYVTLSGEEKNHSKDRVLFQLNFPAHFFISLVTQEWLQHKNRQTFILQLCLDLAFMRNFDWLINWSWFCFHSPEASLFFLCYLLMRAWCIGRKVGGVEEEGNKKTKNHPGKIISQRIECIPLLSFFAL